MISDGGLEGKELNEYLNKFTIIGGFILNSIMLLINLSNFQKKFFFFNNFFKIKF